MPNLRVYELANELGYDSKAILAKIQEMGEFVRSASSTVPSPVVARLRAQLPPRSRPEGLSSQHPESDHKHSPPDRNSLPWGRRLFPQPLAGGPVSPRRREWYRGEPLQGFLKAMLDGHVVSRAANDRPHKAKYWLDEVELARRLSSEWAGCLLGMSTKDILAWLQTRVRPEQALELHSHGVTPKEVSWSYADRGQDPLDVRLRHGIFTVEEVINEVEGRRMQAEAESRL